MDITAPRPPLTDEPDMPIVTTVNIENGTVVEPRTPNPRSGVARGKLRQTLTVGALALAAILPSACSVDAPHALAVGITPPPVASATATASPAPLIASQTAPAAGPTAVQLKAPVSSPAASPASDTNAYMVAPGDTVTSIASRYSVEADSVLAANGLDADTVITPGEVLKLTGPTPSPAAAPAAAPTVQPAAQQRAAAAETKAPVPVPAQAPAPAAPAATRTVYVAGAGGQAMVDRCIGPIHFTPTDGYALFIVQHDTCGGWTQWSGIQVGETVNIVGFGTYSVTGRGIVPNPGTISNVMATFGGLSKAYLQTCIPGTTRMLLIALS